MAGDPRSHLGPEAVSARSDGVFFPCLDGLRAIAALMVVLNHVGTSAGSLGARWPGSFLARTDAGVSIFFLLSGFLLYRPMVAANLAGRPRASTERFWWRRFVRIFPAYWLALGASVFVLGVVTMHSAREAIQYPTLTQIYSGLLVFGGLTQTWSLAVEVSFYAFLPLYAYAMRAVVRRAGHRLRAEVAGVATLFAIGVGTQIVLDVAHRGPSLANGWLPAQMDLFAIGMGLAVLSAWAERVVPPAWFTNFGRRPWVWWAGGVLAFVIVSTQLDLPRNLGPMTAPQDLGRHLLYAAMATCFLVPAAFGGDGGVIRRLLRSSAMAWLGMISYGIFLWHVPIRDALVDHGVLDWVPQARFFTLLAAVLAVTIPVAAASWYLLERPLLESNREPPWRRSVVDPMLRRG